MPNIIKSKSDKRTYKHLVLGNKLEAILISDMEADKSAAALDVRVGCSLDSKEFFGTAHFLEHMLFMGSEKYPSENDYMEYISQNGGMSNAYTSLTNTNYHFDCSNEGFKDGLDRFAQFYISPTLNENSADKEIKAVDSEYNMSLSTDAWHFFNLVQHQSNPESSLHRFNCGNVTSLKKEGMRQQLLNFHKKYYSSNIMRLAISGRHDIETMEKWVNEMFSGIENKDVSVPDLGSPKPYLPENLGSLTRFVPIRDKDIMNLYFILPYTEKEYKTQPMRYISHLVGHEGENSLLSYLINKGWALELSCGEDHELWSFSTLEMDITLTQKGFDEYDQVIEAVFQYMKNICKQGPQDYIFEEMKTLGKINFDYAEKGSHLRYCVNLAKNQQVMQGEDVENIIRKSYEIDHFDKERTQEMLNLVSDPTQCNIYIRSKKFEGKTDKEAPWYSTKYSSEKFSEDLLNKMNNPSCDQSEKKLEIPPPNTLLPKKFDILPEDKAVSQKPILVKTWDNAHLWYSKDDKFKMPKAVVSMKVYTNDCDFGKTLQGRLQALIWQKVVNEYMREFLYNAECASLNFSVNLMHDNIQFQWDGFNDSMIPFVSETIQRIQKMKTQNLEKQFNQVKEKLLMEFHNAYLAHAYQQAFSMINQLMISAAHEPKHLKEILKDYTYDQFAASLKQWMTTGRILSFVKGNLSKDQAVKLLEHARFNFNMKPVAISSLQQVKPVQLPAQQSQQVTIDLFDEKNENSCLLTHFEVGLPGDDKKVDLINQVVMQHLDEPCFNQLRTVEQLGYVVFSRDFGVRNAIGCQFLVQSPEKSNEYIVNSLNNWLLTMKKEINEISEEDFKKTVGAVQTRLAEKDLNLKAENSRQWKEISEHEYNFGRQQEELDLLKTITLQEFKDHFNKTFFSAHTRRLDLQLISRKHAENETEWQESNQKKHFTGSHVQRQDKIKDIASFKKKMSYHQDTIHKKFADFVDSVNKKSGSQGVHQAPVATVRKPAPQFTAKAVENGKIKDVSLSDYLGKYVVLFFWPLDFTFVCPTEICQFNDAAKKFEEEGCVVLGCSTDSHFAHLEYCKKPRKKGGLAPMQIPMVSDLTHQISKDYGCLIQEGGDKGVAFRATYIIDDKGIVRHISISDLPVGRNPEETLRLVQAFKYSDEFGEVCPGKWKPGMKTMVPDVESQKTEEFWKEEHGKDQ